MTASAKFRRLQHQNVVAATAEFLVMPIPIPTAINIIITVAVLISPGCQATHGPRYQQDSSSSTGTNGGNQRPHRMDIAGRVVASKRVMGR